jgi:AcrR family transcriptional regulator
MPTGPSRTSRSGRRANAPKPVVPERRVRLDIDKRRAQLLELGIELFSKHAYEDISIDEVAEIAGISKGLLYHYFNGKRAFYVETLRAASRRLQLLTIPDPALPPAAQLRAGIDAHLRYIQEHGAVYNAVYRGGVSIAPEVSELLEEHREVIMRYILRTIGTLKPRPVLRTAIRAWMAMVEGASLDWIANPAVTRDELRELLVVGYAALLAKTMEMDPKAAAAVKLSAG